LLIKKWCFCFFLGVDPWTYIGGLSYRQRLLQTQVYPFWLVLAIFLWSLIYSLAFQSENRWHLLHIKISNFNRINYCNLLFWLESISFLKTNLYNFYTGRKMIIIIIIIINNNNNININRDMILTWPTNFIHLNFQTKKLCLWRVSMRFVTNPIHQSVQF